jgi:hypothetical protein
MMHMRYDSAGPRGGVLQAAVAFLQDTSFYALVRESSRQANNIKKLGLCHGTPACPLRAAADCWLNGNACHVVTDIWPQ